MRMPRWLLFAPFVCLVAIFAINGAKLGIQQANLTETDVINFYANQYLSDHQSLVGDGAALTDCLAVPGTKPRVWIEVRCTPPVGPAFIYGAGRDGQLIYAGRDGAAPEA